jgi:nucleotide-binding universal stress UspA family protein
LQRAFVGSVTQGVIADSPVPLLVLKPGGKRITAIEKLLVPVDGTAGGALALGAAAALARATNAYINLIQVVPPVPTWMYGGALDYAPAVFYDPAWEEASLNSASAYVTELAERLRKGGLAADGRAVQGPVAMSIEQAAADLDVDVIVMSTHALTGPVRAVLGSVADEVVRNSERPVLLVRRPGGALDSDVTAEAAAPAASP